MATAPISSLKVGQTFKLHVDHTHPEAMILRLVQPHSELELVTKETHCPKKWVYVCVDHPLHMVFGTDDPGTLVVLEE